MNDPQETSTAAQVIAETLDWRQMDQVERFLSNMVHTEDDLTEGERQTIHEVRMGLQRMRNWADDLKLYKFEFFWDEDGGPCDVKTFFTRGYNSSHAVSQLRRWHPEYIGRIGVMTPPGSKVREAISWK